MAAEGPASANPVAHLDEYELRHLASHLAGSDRARDLHRLLALEWTDPAESVRHNAWYEAHDAAGEPAGFLTDVGMARRLAEDATAAEVAQATPASSFALGLRYSLVSASIHSVAGSIPPVLVAALVRAGVWSAEKGLAYGRQDPSPYDRVKTLSALLSVLSGPLGVAAAREALAAAREVGSEQQAELLAAHARVLPDEVLSEAVSLARVINAPPTDEGTAALRAAWLALVSRLPAGDALAAARELAPEWARAELLACAGSKAAEPLRTEILEEALGVATADDYDLGVATSLEHMAPYLSERVQPRALDAVAALGGISRRMALEALGPVLEPELAERGVELAMALDDNCVALAVLAGRLPPAPREELLGRALAAVRAVSGDWVRAHRLAAIGPSLTGRSLDEALADALAIAEPSTRVLALAGLVDHIPAPAQERVRTQALDAALAIPDEEGRAESLALISPHLSLPLRRDALSAARALGADLRRSRVLELLLPMLPEREGLEAALELGDEQARSAALAALSPELPRELAARAVDAALELSAWRDRGQALDGLIPHLPPDLLLRVLASVRAAGDDAERLSALGALAEHSPEPVRRELLATALDESRRLRDGLARVKAVAGIAARLPEPAATELMGEALAEARGLDGELARDRAIAFVGERVPAALAEQAIDAASTLETDSSRISAAAPAIARLPAERRREAVEDALERALAVDEPTAWEVAVRAIAPQLTEALAERAYRATAKLDYAPSQARALEVLGPRLPEALVPEAVALARGLGGSLASNALAGLVPRLPRAQALEAAVELESGPDRAEALLALAPALAQAEMPAALAAARAIEQPVWRARVLLALRPSVAEPLAAEILREAVEATALIEFEEPLSETLALALPQLLALPRPELWAAWRRLLASLDGRTRSYAFGAITALTPAIRELGGPEAVRDAVQSVDDVAAWWP